ncbi:metal dependent phosphohydrolase [Haloarcula japonica DSM 6131]|uniref:Metal dependent phosphohydrolase n=2 Tax=Haloarcula japonica TaxID=29282 RepID=M0LLH8_HALJT|nr:metal dependent phosphohydrolase [Haloarcula japonica DSM 6131]
MKSYFGNISFNNKKLDKNLLYHQLKNDDILSSIFGDRFSESEEEEIKNLLEFFVDRQNHSLRKKYSDKYYLSEIMDSTIDADRLDYLFRDSHNLKYGLPTDETNLRKLIGTVQTKSVETDDGLELRRLCWPGSKKRQIEDLLKERRVLYTDVYESDSKIAVDEMVTHGLYHFLQYYDIDGARGGVDAEIMDEIALLTDTDLLNFFMDVGEPFFSRELIKDVYRGSFFTPIHDFEIEYPSENGSPNEPNRLEAANEEIKNIIDPNSPVDETTAREVRKVIKKTGGGLVFKELLFILVWEMLDRYHEQTKLESLFWEELMDDSHLRDIYTQSLLERYGMTDELSEYTDLVPEHYDSIYNIPSIFISIPTYVTRKRAENEIWEKEDSDTSIEWYDPPENEELDLPLRKQFQSKRVIICGPEPFVENDIDDKIEEKFKTFVKDVDNWLTPEIFR